MTNDASKNTTMSKGMSHSRTNPDIKANKIAVIPPIIDDKETYFVMYKLIKKANKTVKNNKGAQNNKTPPDVATALPPRNPAKIG